MKIKIGQSEIFNGWVVVSKHRTYSHVMESTLSDTRKEAIKRAIVHIHGRERTDYSIQVMNQDIKITWKQMREHNGYSVQKISFKIKFGI